MLWSSLRETSGRRSPRPHPTFRLRTHRKAQRALILRGLLLAIRAPQRLRWRIMPRSQSRHTGPNLCWGRQLSGRRCIVSIFNADSFDWARENSAEDILARTREGTGGTAKEREGAVANVEQPGYPTSPRAEIAGESQTSSGLPKLIPFLPGWLNWFLLTFVLGVVALLAWMLLNRDKIWNHGVSGPPCPPLTVGPVAPDSSFAPAGSVRR